MAITLDQTIAQKQHSWVSALLGSQTFWVLIAVILACLFLSLRDRRLRDAEEPLQHHPQRHLRRHHRARHDDGDHHRRHRPVGRLGALPVQHGARRSRCMPATASRSASPPRSRTALRRRRLQRRADRLSRLSALRGDARHAVDRAQPGDGRLQQHRGLPVRARPRQAAGARRRRLAVRHRQPGALHDRAGADHRLRAALDQVRPPCLRHRRQRARGDADRRAGASRSRSRST